MRRAVRRLLALLGFGRLRPPSRPDPDPYAWRPVARRPEPKPRSGAVAVMEPDE